MKHETKFKCERARPDPIYKNYRDHVMAVSNDNGNLIEHYRYSAFGEPEIYGPTGTRLAATAIDNDILWNVRRFEAGNGLYMYLYRDYDAASGRWPSRDPIEEEGGVNMYEFVLNSSLNYYDIFGLSGCCPQSNFTCDDCSNQCASCDGPSGAKSTCENACRNAKLSMKCGPDGDDDGGEGGGGGGGGKDDDDDKGGGGGGGCRDKKGFAKCMANVGANLALDLIPYVGGVKGAAGAKVDLLNGLGGALSLGGPGAGAAADGGEYAANRSYNSSGGDARLNHYNGLANRNGLGAGARSARSGLSMLKSFGRALPLLGDAMDIYEAGRDSVSCYEIYCK